MFDALFLGESDDGTVAKCVVRNDRRPHASVEPSRSIQRYRERVAFPADVQMVATDFVGRVFSNKYAEHDVFPSPGELKLLLSSGVCPKHLFGAAVFAQNNCTRNGSQLGSAA